MTAVFNSADRIITMAMVDAGLLESGGTPSADQYARYLQRLNDVINAEQVSGLKLWLNSDTTIPLTAGKGSYTLGPAGDVVMTKPMRIIEAYYLDSSSIRRPLIAAAWHDWIQLSQVTQTGDVNQYFVEKLLTYLTVHLWNVPDSTTATGTVHVLAQLQVTNFTTVNDSIDFPNEWFIFLRWALADDICTGQPKEITDRCAQKAMFYRQILENWDVEDVSVTFQADVRGGRNPWH